MKRIFFLILTALVSIILVNSCDMKFGSGETAFEESFLYGKWQTGTLFYKYASDYTGATWDTADDVTEEEAMKFTWTLVNAEFTHIYVTELNATKAAIPKVYTVTTLTADKLIYEDDYGKEWVFSKVR